MIPLKRSLPPIFFLLWTVTFVSTGFLSNCYAGARAEIKDELLAVGVAKVEQSNLVAAKSEALSGAIGKAVEEYLLLRIGEAGAINNFDRVAREILPTANGEIENFQILAENVSAGEYRVLVKVKINRESLDEKLRSSGIIFEQISQGNLLFMVSEEKGNETRYWWKGPDFFSNLNESEVYLYNFFQERGFKPINHTFGAGEEMLSPDMAKIPLDRESALKWGKLLSADYVITGECVSRGDSGVSLALQVLSVKDDLLITEGTQTGLAGEQLEDVVRKLAERLIPSIISLEGENSGVTQHVLVTFKGLRNYQEYTTVQQYLKEGIPEIKSAKQSRLSKGMLSLRVAFTGKREQLVRRLLNQEKLSLTLALESETDSQIVLRVVQ